METLYHATRLENLDKILIKGLKPFIPNSRKEKPKGIYLTKFPFNWMFWASVCGSKKGVLLTIDVRGLKLKQDLHEDWRDLEIDSEGDFFCSNEIEPERIINVAVETKKNQFEDLKV